MSKTITISDETFEALKGQIKEMEKVKVYPIAMIGGDNFLKRLILNLPDNYLSGPYKGKAFSIGQFGELGTTFDKTESRGFYKNERQVFPTVKEQKSG